jgi:hypothetical protein
LAAGIGPLGAACVVVHANSEMVTPSANTK